jgi:hypothetical protein
MTILRRLRYLNEGGGTRTHYLEIKSLLLYLLSYAPAGPKRGAPGGETQGQTRLRSIPMRPSQWMSRLALLLSLAPVSARAQGAGPDRWQIGLESGDYIWDLRLVRLAGDSLIFRQADSLGSVSVQNVRELRLIRKTEVRLGEGVGGAMAALMGSDDEVYDLNTMDYGARLRALQQVLLLHPPKP